MQFGGQSATLLAREEQGAQNLESMFGQQRFDAQQYAFFTNLDSGEIGGGIEDDIEDSSGEQLEEDRAWEEYQHEISVELDQLTLGNMDPQAPPNLLKPTINFNQHQNGFTTKQQSPRQPQIHQPLNFAQQNELLNQQQQQIQQQQQQQQQVKQQQQQQQQHMQLFDRIEEMQPQAINLADLERQMIQEAQLPQQQISPPLPPFNQIPPPPPPLILEGQLDISTNGVQKPEFLGQSQILVNPMQQLQSMQQQQQLFQLLQQQLGIKQQYNMQNSIVGGSSITPTLGRDLVEWSLPPGFDGGKFMSKPEIGFVLRCSWLAINVMGNPYEDDYYFQAYMFKNLGINKTHFAPQKLKELTSCDEKTRSNELVEFVPVEGLGKIVRHRANAPKQMVEISSESQGGTMRLEQEPRLAIRVLIEDCFLHILDIEDIDRFIAVNKNQNRRDVGDLFSRRTNFIRDLCKALDLTQDDANSIDRILPDQKFLMFMELEKGRSLMARVLSVVYPPWLGHMDLMMGGNYQHQVGLHAVHGVLRNVRKIFSANIGSVQGILQKTYRISYQMVQLFKQLNDSQDILDCMSELCKGDLGVQIQGDQFMGEMFCFVNPVPQNLEADQEQQSWMAEILFQLIVKGFEFGVPVTGRVEWAAGVGIIMDAIILLIQQIHIMLSQGKIIPQQIEDVYQSLVPQNLLQLLLQQPMDQLKKDELDLLFRQLRQIQQFGQ